MGLYIGNVDTRQLLNTLVNRQIWKGYSDISLNVLLHGCISIIKLCAVGGFLL